MAHLFKSWGKLHHFSCPVTLTTFHYKNRFHNIHNISVIQGSVTCDAQGETGTRDIIGR